ncbi:hypothetical protein RZS08_44635, partial [Arthrospira platensis SPKY1]|nr:hypothetical protein [Arthrospira platensis SPKY1]
MPQYVCHIKGYAQLPALIAKLRPCPRATFGRIMIPVHQLKPATEFGTSPALLNSLKLIDTAATAMINDTHTSQESGQIRIGFLSTIDSPLLPFFIAAARSYG